MGCYSYPRICFGWKEPSNDREIDCETIENICEKYDIDFRVFTTHINYNTKCSSIYGVLCDFDEETGNINVSDEYKVKILDIYDLLKKINNIGTDCKI